MKAAQVGQPHAQGDAMKHYRLEGKHFVPFVGKAH